MHNKTRSSLLSLNQRHFGETLKSTMKLSNFMQKDLNIREDKIGVFHFEDWKYMKKFHTSNPGSQSTSNFNNKSNNLQSHSHINQKLLKIPHLNTDMMDTILRGGDNKEENLTSKFERDYNGVQIGQESESRSDINKYLMKNLVIDKLVRTKKNSAQFQLTETYLRDLVTQTSAKFKGLNETFNPSTKTTEFLRTCNEISVEYNDRIRQFEGNRKLNNIANLMAKKCQENTQENWLFKDLEKRFDYILRIRKSREQSKILEDSLQEKFTEINELRKQQSNIKRDGKKVSERESLLDNDGKTKEQRDRELEKQMEFQMRMYGQKGVEKFKKNIFFENVGFYQNMIDLIQKSMFPIQKQIKEVKDLIVINQLKVKNVLQYLLKKPEVAQQKGLLIDDIIAQQKLADYQTKPEEIANIFTEPELNYIFKSSEIKYLWLEKDGVLNQSSLNLLQDIKKRSSGETQGVIDSTIMGTLNKICDESGKRVNQYLSDILKQNVKTYLPVINNKLSSKTTEKQWELVVPEILEKSNHIKVTDINDFNPEENNNCSELKESMVKERYKENIKITLAKRHKALMKEFFADLRETQSNLIDLHKHTLRNGLMSRQCQYFSKRNLDEAVKQIAQKETIQENYQNKTMDKLKLCTIVSNSTLKKKSSIANLLNMKCSKD